MPAIKILQASRETVTSDEAYERLQKYINKWVPLHSINFAPSGKLSYFATLVFDTVTCVFAHNDPGFAYDLQGIELKPLDVKLEFTVHCSECGKEHTVELTEQEYYNLWYNSLGKECPALSDMFICVDCMNKDIEDQEDEIHRMVRESVEGMVQIDNDDYEKELKHE